MHCAHAQTLKSGSREKSLKYNIAHTYITMLGEGDEIKNEILDQKRRKKQKNWTPDEFAVLTSLATEKASILDKRYDNALYLRNITAKNLFCDFLLSIS